MSTNGKSAPHILILGGGLSGLLLAQALTKQGMSFEIYERDESLQARFQGYAIGISGIIDDILGCVHADLPPIDTVSHLYPLTLRPQLNFFSGDKKFVGEATDDPKVLFANRSRLRSWLATDLDINWNKKAVKIDDKDNLVTVTFEDGSLASGDVLVGADGISSIVRSHIFNGNIPLQTIPEAVIIGETKSVPGSGFRLFTCLDYISEDAQTASYQWFLVWGDEVFAKDPGSYWTTSATKQEMLDYALKRVQPLDERLTEVVRSTKPEGIIHPPLQFRDLILNTMPNTRCTLLGDAAHPMAPFRGRGGVQAMIDAMNLAKILAKAKPEDLLSSLKEYQDEMLLRASEIVKLSRRVGQNKGKILVWGHEIREVSW